MDLLKGQTLTHEAFMDVALYHPEHGYYARRASLGQGGDFSTSATLSPLFAEAVASWIRQAAERLKLPKPWPIIELGPGDASLAASLRAHFAGSEIVFYLVETSEPLKARQVERLGSDVHHAPTLPDALKATNGCGLIIANEFADAFPAIQLQWGDGDWHEGCVSFDAQGEPTEGIADFGGGVDAEAPTYPKDQQRIYVHKRYHEWLQQSIPALRLGAFLSIDYGQTFPSGECRAYAKQQRYEGLEVYREAGKRDITCDVNFSDLRRWGEQLGLTTHALGTQRDFFIRYLPEAEAREHNDEALAFLMKPIGAGGAFMVLEQERKS